MTVSGEAYFDVAENSRKPFIVSTQNMEMKVLGTQFNVYSYPGAGCIKTDLIEGSLMVYSKESPNTSVTLKPDEQIVVKNGKMSLRKISPTRWYRRDLKNNSENTEVQCSKRYRKQRYHNYKINLLIP